MNLVSFRILWRKNNADVRKEWYTLNTKHSCLLTCFELDIFLEKMDVQFMFKLLCQLLFCMHVEGLAGNTYGEFCFQWLGVKSFHRKTTAQASCVWAFEFFQRSMNPQDTHDIQFVYNYFNVKKQSCCRVNRVCLAAESLLKLQKVSTGCWA